MHQGSGSIFSVLARSVLTGIMCNGLWLVEILTIKGWEGLNWLNGYMNSVFLIIPLMVMAFFFSLRRSVKFISVNTAIAILALTIISLIAYESGRSFLYLIYSRFLTLTYSPWQIGGIVVLGVLIPIGVYLIGYSFVINRLLIKIPILLGITLFLSSIFLSLALAMLTIQLHSGFGTGQSFVDAVKMGYPIFWLNALLGTAAVLVAKKERHTVTNLET